MTYDLGELSVRHDQLDHVPVLRLRGDIDMATCSTVAAALWARPRGLLVVDLTEVGFVGSCGLVLLAQTQQRAAAVGGRVLVAGCQPAVLRALEVTDLLSVVSPHPTVADALASLIEIPAPRAPR
ncbi:STAS domain-containing protein [Actinokineospora iranica]|uniref:Anti-sigma factor antagonist n=1 Tax=Actinokineospora iranica TaxID=1271860 RepID=A0A1G6YV24_9PSEU|nr:STAS domain-containing protein [Actinokineospora iranica]SDD93487.1 anti-anti-sigma factor [Actinokineospora iranica]